MPSCLDFVKRVSSVPPVTVTAASQPVKFGILGAAAIAPTALISPANTHPEVQVYAVAARDQKRAEAFAKKHGIEKAYGGSTGYQRSSFFFPCVSLTYGLYTV